MSELLLFFFTTDPIAAQEAQNSGVDSIIVDWENHQKKYRQQDYSTEINHDTPEDVRKLSEQLSIPVTVRINALYPGTKLEIQKAIDLGARIIMLPMAQNHKEVEEFMNLVDGRAKTIIQIETDNLVDDCENLRSIPWDFAYIGLNDLMISRKGRNIWDAVLDGTVEHIYQVLENRAVGFGGVTVINGGYPIPFLDLLKEMVRLDCSLSFLRRSFKKDIKNLDMASEIKSIRQAWNEMSKRSQEEIATDQKRLHDIIRTAQESTH